MRRAQVRLAVAHTCILATVAVGLGLTAVPLAEASCAGPQLRLQQNGSSIGPRRVGEGLDEQLLYDVDRDQPLLVTAINLTFGCDDTASGTPGCGAPASEPVTPAAPIENAELRIEQRDRRWALARLDVGPDLTSHREVRLPAALRAGSARLMITDPQNGDYGEVTLVLA